MKNPDAINDSFNRLPDETVLQIINKLIEFKTLCFCKLVSKRFYSIVHQIDAISLTIPSKINFLPSDDDCQTLQSVIESLKKFTSFKSLSIDWQSSSSVVEDDPFSFMCKFKLCTRINSFLFISPNSFSNTNVVEVEVEVEEYDMELTMKKLVIANDCFGHVFVKLKILDICNSAFPLLENVSITNSVKKGTVSYNSVGGGGGGMIDEVNKCSLPTPHIMRLCYIPLLRLPVSGYVMAGVTLYLWGNDDLPNGNDKFINVYDFENNDFDEKEEAAYNEAVAQIFNNYREKIKTV